MASDLAERIATDVIDGARARAVYTGTGQTMPTHAELISIIRNVLEEYYVMPKQAGEGLEAGAAFIREQQAAEIDRLRAYVERQPCHCSRDFMKTKIICERCKALEGGDAKP